MNRPPPPARQVVVEAEPEQLRRLARLRLLRDLRARQRAERWRYRPDLWLAEVLPDAEPTDYQVGTLLDLVRAWRTAVRGPHGLGKTTTNAWAILWFATTRDLLGIDWKVVTTAGGARQLREYLWPEVHKWVPLMRWGVLGCDPWQQGAQLLDQAIQLRHGSAFAAAAAQPALIEGAHADSLLVIYDESKAIGAATFDAVEGAFAGATNQPGQLPEAYALAQSTPGEPTGRFFDIHRRRPGLEDWHARHVTLEQAVAAGRISQAWVEARRRQWEQAAPQLWHNRVLGEFYASTENGVIPQAWVEAAVERWYTERVQGWDRPLTDLGVDVATTGTDSTAYAYRYGHALWKVEADPYTPDTTKIAERVVEVLTAHDACRAVIDSNGVGAGVYDQVAAAVGRRAQPFVAQGASKRTDRSGQLRFYNQRAEAWWHLRDELDPAYNPTLALPDDDELLGDLVAPRWHEVGKGLIAIESKDDIRARIGRSPDKGDAVVQSVWPAHHGARMTSGGRAA